MYLLDTDHLSLLERRSAGSTSLQRRLETVPSSEIATTSIAYEEQMRGWLALASRSSTIERMFAVYSRLLLHIDTFKRIPVVPFDGKAGAEYERLRTARIRIGTMDPKIAAITLAHGATLLSRNLADLGKVAGLRVEDWTL